MPTAIPKASSSRTPKWPASTSNGCSPTRAAVGALTRCFLDCSPGCEFCLSGYVTALGNDFGWQARLSGIEKFLDRVTWRGELVRDRLVGKMDFAETKRRQLVN